MVNAKKNTASSKAPETAADVSTSGFPLFFSQPKVISLDRHAKAKVRDDITMAFAQKTNSIPLTVSDIAEAAKYYPIGFTPGDTIIPVAIVGLEQENYFITAEEKWLERTYIPAYARKYPFVFMDNSENDQLILCIDEAALTFDESAKGTAIYENDQPSASTQNALNFCVAYQEQHRLTRQFCDALAKYDLLTQQRSNIKLANGREIQLNGFQLIDAKKFQALSDDVLLEMQKQGMLALIHYILQANSNWRNLLDLGNIKERAATEKAE